MPGARRTQAQRREATVGKLLQATVESLADRGYARTSTGEICKRAGVSQGGLFRHFDTRIDLIAAAIEHVGRSHVTAIEHLRDEGLNIEAVVRFAQQATRSPTHAAWHEVMVAARTDADLRERVSPVLERYERALHDLARSLLPESHPNPGGAEMVVLSVLHMFDSEAVTRRVHSSPAIEDARLSWAIDLLSALLADPIHPST